MSIFSKIANWASNNSGSLLGAGASILGTMMNNKTQLKQQQREMDFARESYATQRADTLADRSHEEAYNSPIQQAQRLREAGMSPMDYMGEPVSTSTGDSGEISQPSHADLKNPMASLSEFINNERQFDFAKSQFQETKRVNDSVIEKNKAEAQMATNNAVANLGRYKMDTQRFDMEKEQFAEMIRGMRLDNKAKSILNSHNEVLFPLLERAQKVTTELAEDTKDTMQKKCVAELNLDYAKAKELAQMYEIRGPEAVYAKLTEDMYGEEAGTIKAQIMEQLHCDENEAACAMVESGIERGVLTGEYGSGVQSLAYGSRVAQAAAHNGNNGSASRGLFGSLVKALAK